MTARARRIGAVPLQHLAHRRGLAGLVLLEIGIHIREAEAAPARPEYSRAATCREWSATCGWDTTSPPERSPCPAGPSGSRRSASPAGSGCRTRRECRSARPAVRSERCSSRSAVPRCCGPPSADRRGTAPFPCTKALRRLSSNQGYFRFASGVSSHTLRVCSHWPKKLLTSAARARGSASMRRAC